MNKKILEIIVDKNNLKGPGVFEHILLVLHRVFDDFNKNKKISKNNKNKVTFSFEITKIGNKIRFYIISPEKYSNFITNQIYAHYNDIEIVEVQDYLEKIPNDKIYVGKVKLTNHYLFPIKNFTELQGDANKDLIDPFSSITSALGKTGKYTLNTFQINFTPILSNKWKKGLAGTIKVLMSKYPSFIKKILLNKNFIYFKIILYPFILLFKFIGLIFKKTEDNVSIDLENANNELGIKLNNIKIPNTMKNKIESEGYNTSINIIHAGEDHFEAYSSIKEIFSTLNIFSNYGSNSFCLSGIIRDTENIKNRNININDIMILSTNELSGLVHLPTSYVKTPQINWVLSRVFEPPGNLPILDDDKKIDLTPIGKTNFRGTNLGFGIGSNDRRRHLYVLGKTGMGKTTLLENMIIDDMRKGRGVAVIDPHGDLAEGLIGFIPKSRTNQTIIFDPSDKDWPIAFNMLDNVNPEHRALIASGIVGIFKKIFGDSWGPRLEHILRNTILALIEYPNSTLISIPLMLTSDVFRFKVVSKIKDPVVKKFWVSEFAKMSPTQRVEASSPILNKVGQFLSSTILRNVLGQPKNTFSLRWAMDNKKIIIVNLSKGRIGEDVSSLLGAMLVTKFQMDAMSRADIPKEKRIDFYLYVDEFQNFATDSFVTILSEARKYKLNLVMANQFIDQMQESVRGAVFGNVGTIVSFQVGYHDASILKDALSGEILENDLMNLKKHNIYIKQLIDGMPSSVFSAITYGPNIKDEEIFQTRYSKILSVSREKYSKPRELVEGKINKTLQDIEKSEQQFEQKKIENKEKNKNK